MGQQTRCPNCQSVVDVTTAAVGPLLECPNCHRLFEVDPAAAPQPLRAFEGGGARSVVPVLAAAFGGLLVFGVLAGMLSVGLGRAQEAARRTACVGSNARMIGMAMFQYAGDYGDKFPPAINPDDPNEPAQYRFAYLMKYGYINSPKVFLCPSHRPVHAGSMQELVDEKGNPVEMLTDASLASLAKVMLADNACSYGVDPKANHSDSPTRALVADRPDPRYWGTGVNSPSSGDGSNSDNHKGEGQNIFYNDGHVQMVQYSSG